MVPHDSNIAPALAAALDHAGTRLTIDLAALADNWRKLAALVAPAVCGAVVKANAYGLGVEKVAPALWAAGARSFFVALPQEGMELRALLPAADIHVLGGLLPGTADLFSALDLRPVLGSLAEVADWAAHCRHLARDLPAAIHVDTGMNRLGLTVSEAHHLAAAGAGFTPSLIMTHLACADTPGHPLTPVQRRRFEEARAAFPGIPASLANSAGCLTGRDYHLDLVRPGIALYGGAAIAGAAPLKDVVRLEAPVIQVRTGLPGDSVGYGAAYRLARESRIAIVSLGYADGFHRAFGSTDARPGAQAVVAGHRCAVVGRISMDLTAIDVTDLPRDAVRRGDRAVLLGEGITIDALAAHGGTIGYEVLTSLGRRYLRTYAGGGGMVA